MSNRYYISSNELYHWKYIKREKKNGKWIYTYDKPVSSKDDSKSESNYTQADIDRVNKLYETGKRNAERNRQIEANLPAIRRNTDKLLSSTTIIGTGKDATKYYNVGKIDRAIEEREKDWAEAKDKVNKDLKKNEVDSNDFFSWNHVVRDAFSGDEIARYRARGKLERGIESVKEYLKDRFGEDEHKAYLEAYARSQILSRERQEAANAATEARKKMNDSNASSAERKQAKKDFDKAVDNFNDSDAKWKNSTEELKNSSKVFYDTPLGRITEFHESIDVAKDYVSSLFNKKRKK